MKPVSWGRTLRRPARIILLGALFAAFGGCGAEIGECLNELFRDRAPDPGAFRSDFGVELQPVVGGARFPVVLAFLPDGALLYTEKDTGRIRVATPAGELLPQPLADFPVANTGDSGFLGLALDPNFSQNQFLYAGFTANELPADNPFPRSEYRIVRVTLDGWSVVPGSEVTLARLPASGLPGHEGGNLHFGPDGHLYVSLGDRRINNAPNPEALDPNTLAGKIIRLLPDGGVPADNPFGPGNPAFALGLRNSFDFAFDPVSRLLFAAENGPTGDDELLLIEAGLNYGWPVVSGFADAPDEIAYAAETPAYREPLALLGRAPTGIAFNPGDAYGAALHNDLFVAEFVTGAVRRVRLTADRRAVEAVENFAEGIPGGMNDLEFGPDGLIFVSTSDAIYKLVPAAQQ